MHNLVAVFKHHFCHLTEIKPYQKWTECTAECSLYLHKIDNGGQFSVFTFWNWRRTAEQIVWHWSPWLWLDPWSRDIVAFVWIFHQRQHFYSKCGSPIAHPPSLLTILSTFNVTLTQQSTDFSPKIIPLLCVLFYFYHLHHLSVNFLRQAFIVQRHFDLIEVRLSPVHQSKAWWQWSMQPREEPREQPREELALKYTSSSRTSF